MIELIEANRWNESSMSRRKYLIDTSISPKQGAPVIFGFKNKPDFEWSGWRFIDHWNGRETNDIIKPVVVIFSLW